MASCSSSSRPYALLLLFSFFLRLTAAVGADENSDGLQLPDTQRSPPPADNFLLVLMSHMPQEVSLSCKAQMPGGHSFFNSFVLRTREARRKYFSLPGNSFQEGYAVSCYYAYRGNFAADITIFDSQRPDAGECRVKNGGCRFLIGADSVMYNITRSGGKQIIGDLPIKQCRWFLFFAYDCQQKPHSHPFAGRTISRWQWWTNS